MKYLLFILLLTGCVHQKYVDVPLYVIDLDNMVCAEYKYINLENLQVQHVKDHELMKCNGVVGYTPKDYSSKVKRWIVDMIESSKKLVHEYRRQF